MDKLIIIVWTIKIYGICRSSLYPPVSNIAGCKIHPSMIFPEKTRSCRCPCPRLLFEDGEPLTFGEFMDAMLTLRGSNSTTVKDIAHLAAVNTRHVWRWWWRPWEEVQETMASGKSWCLIVKSPWLLVNCFFTTQWYSLSPIRKKIPWICPRMESSSNMVSHGIFGGKTHKSPENEGNPSLWPQFPGWSLMT